jgi:hypothetical protein
MRLIVNHLEEFLGIKALMWRPKEKYPACRIEVKRILLGLFGMK